MELNSRAEAIAIADHCIDPEALVRIGQHEFNLNKLSDFQLGGNINRHSFLRKIVTLALKDTSALLHMEEQFDREIYREPL